MKIDKKPRHFIQRIIDNDNLSGKFDHRVHTRFHPEPNGYILIDNAKSIYFNFSIDVMSYGSILKLSAI